MIIKNLPKTMKAVGLYKYLPITNIESLLDLEIGLPKLQKSEVLVEVKATAVNPLDTKQRAPKPKIETSPRILGWDGAGVIVDKGEKSNLFNVGDEVFFIADVRKNGTNAQYVALEEILVAQKPKQLTFEQAAAMPLTTYTAYEALYDRLKITSEDNGKSLLILNSAGGVGSVASQLAKNLGLRVIGTASRPESAAFSRKFGADIILDHSKDLIAQLEANGYSDGVDFVLVNYDPFPYWDTLTKAVKPQGRLCMLVESSKPVDLTALKDKSITLVYEMMFTRIKYNTEDKIRYHEILQEASKMFDNDKLKSTLVKTLSPINATNLREAHRSIEEKSVMGKIVLSGF